MFTLTPALLYHTFLGHATGLTGACNNKVGGRPCIRSTLYPNNRPVVPHALWKDFDPNRNCVQDNCTHVYGRALMMGVRERITVAKS